MKAGNGHKKHEKTRKVKDRSQTVTRFFSCLFSCRFVFLVAIPEHARIRLPLRRDRAALGVLVRQSAGRGVRAFAAVSRATGFTGRAACAAAGAAPSPRG
jgi:hypothetical protein